MYVRKERWCVCEEGETVCIQSMRIRAQSGKLDCFFEVAGIIQA